MKSTTVQAIVIVFVLIAIGAAVYFWQFSDKKDLGGSTPSGPTASATQTPGPTEPDIKYPISENDTPQNKEASGAETGQGKEEAPLPSLDESDQPFFAALIALIGRETVEAAFNPQEFIRHVVVTVENATGRQLPQQFTPFKTLESPFAVSGEGDNQMIDPANYARYLPYMQVLKAADVAKLTRLYKHYYSLFQAAYHELGMRGYFNDRMVQVIDSLLETPDAPVEVKLMLEGAHYKFADSHLEALNGGQKVLLLVGPENAELIKQRLREIRSVLTRAKG